MWQSGKIDGMRLVAGTQVSRCGVGECEVGGYRVRICGVGKRCERSGACGRLVAGAQVSGRGVGV
eukprot:1161245-Pelagomonas_calceolata.AAC.2